MKAIFFLGFVTLFVCAACSLSQQNQSSPTEKGKVNASRSLGRFMCLPGTSFQMAPIESIDESGGFSKGYERRIHNYLFMDATKATFTKLLDRNSYAIVERFVFPNVVSQSYPGDPSDIISCSNTNEKVRWLLYSIVKEDSNSDRQLTIEDQKILAISDIRGLNYSELIPNVQEIYGRAFQKESNRLVIVYSSRDRKQVSVIDLPTQKIVSTKLLPDLGKDVK